MNKSAPQHVTYRIQGAGVDANDLSDALRLVISEIENGTTSGYLAKTYDFMGIAPTTVLEPLFEDQKMRTVVEITETTPERVAHTLGLIADQIDEGFTSGMDRHDEGSYSYDTTTTR